MIQEQKPSLEDVVHFGVKGMKWGHHQAEHPTNAAYSTRMQSIDRQEHGARAVKRINQRMNEGKTRVEALHREDVRNAKQKLAIAGGLFVASMIANEGHIHVSNFSKYTAQRAHDNRTAAGNAALALGSSAARTAFAKKSRGVHNITTMR